MDAFFLDLYRSAAEPLPDGVDLDETGEHAAAFADSLWTAWAAGEGPLPELLAKLQDSSLPGVAIRHLSPGRPHDLYWQYVAWFGEAGSADSAANAEGDDEEGRPASWPTFYRVWHAPQFFSRSASAQRTQGRRFKLGSAGSACSQPLQVVPAVAADTGIGPGSMC